MATLDANAFLSTAGSARYIDPILWSAAIEQYASETVIMVPFGVMDTRALGKPGEQINIAKNVAFTAAALTEGTKTPVSAITWDQVTVTFVEYGLAKQVSELQLAKGLTGVFNDIVMNMGESLGQKKDEVLMAAIVAGPSSTIYADGVTSGSISSSNVFNTDLIADGKSTMRVSNRKPKYLIINPACENSLLKDTQFVDASIYGGRETVLNGEIGKYIGLRVISNNVVTSASENSVTVYKNVLLGDRPFVYAPKIGVQMRWKEDSVLDRAITFEAHETYGVSVLNSESIIVLKSVGGI